MRQLCGRSGSLWQLCFRSVVVLLQVGTIVTAVWQECGSVTQMRQKNRCIEADLE